MGTWAAKTEKKEKEKKKSKEEGTRQRKQKRRRRRKEEDEAAFECKKSPKKIIYSYRPKLASRPEFVEIDRNGLEFFPRWNRGASRSSLHVDTRFSSHSGRNGNGTELTTLL